MTFTKPKLEVVHVKIAIMGLPWSGKSYSSLLLARGLVGEAGRIAVIDTENNASAYYCDLTPFDSLQIDSGYKYNDFIKAIDEAVAAKYDCLIIDSASHIWEGVLAFKSKLDESGGNKFANWAIAGPRYKEIINKLIHAPLHVIACIRLKPDTVVDVIDGKSIPHKVGLAPMMREGSEYEFSICYELSRDNLAIVTKDRTKTQPQEPFKITTETGAIIADWLVGKAPQAPQQTEDCEAVKIIKQLLKLYDEKKGQRLICVLNERYGTDFETYGVDAVNYLNKLLQKEKNNGI